MYKLTDAALLALFDELIKNGMLARSATIPPPKSDIPASKLESYPKVPGFVFLVT
jgi:hypothetical protein